MSEQFNGNGHSKERARSLLDQMFAEKFSTIDDAAFESAGRYGEGLRKVYKLRKMTGGPELAQKKWVDLCTNESMYKELDQQEEPLPPLNEPVKEKPTNNAPTSIDDIMPPLSKETLLSPDNGTCPLRELFISYSKSVSPEGFDDFHEAAFWTLLSIVAARRVYADFTDELYTSLYVIFVARTSLFAKSHTARSVKKVLRAAGLDWLLGADRTTPQKLLSDMAGKYVPADYSQLDEEEQNRIALKLAMSGQLGWINDEFGKFVKGMLRQSSIMSDFADIFLTFDNGEAEYKNSTIQRGGEPIKNPYLAMLGCMTPANVRDNAKSGAEFWGDGFWARFIFISPPPGGGKDAPFDRGKVPVPTELIKGLRAMHDRLGVPTVSIVETLDDKGSPTGKHEIIPVEKRRETPLKISDDAYDAWKRYRSDLKRMITSFAGEDLDGSYDRLPTIAMRIATLAAAGVGSPTIELSHWALAQDFAEKCRLSLHYFYNQVNAAKEVQTMDDKVVEAVTSLLDKDKSKKTVSARDVGRVLHKSSKEVEPYLRALSKGDDSELEEVKGRQSPGYKLRGVE